MMSRAAIAPVVMIGLGGDLRQVYTGDEFEELACSGYCRVVQVNRVGPFGERDDTCAVDIVTTGEMQRRRMTRELWAAMAPEFRGSDYAPALGLGE